MIMKMKRFGNLVTINDWSELWLSEGFASFYVSEFLSKQHPHLAINEYFLHLSQLLVRQVLEVEFFDYLYWS